MIADRFGHFFPARPRSGKESRIEFAVKSLAQTVIPESIRSTQLGGAHSGDAFHVGKAILSLICKFNEESFKDCWKEDDKQFLQSVLRKFEDAAKFFNVSEANSTPIYARLEALQNGEHLILPTGYPSRDGVMGHMTYCIIEKNRDDYDFFEINTNGDSENMERSVYLSRGILGKSLRCTTLNAAKELIVSLLKMYGGGYAVGGLNDPPTLGSIYEAIWRNGGWGIRNSKASECTRIKLEELNRPRQMVATQRSDNCSFASRDEIIRFLILKEISSKIEKPINEADVLQAGDLLFRKVMLCIKAYH
ncbi:MAG: hypothetical protein LBS68_02135, partial [Puniceicoccales bacterium]|nr:hypothetical protein [Puniceicoccales bacterium]